MKTAKIKLQIKLLLPLFFTIFIFFITHLALSYFATKFILYSGIFSYGELLENMPYPDFLKRLASFDGLHYLKISQNGYEGNSPAFFPLYPIFISALSFISGINHLPISLLISLTSFYLYLFFLDKLLLKVGLTKIEKKWVYIFILLFPTSFFFITAYTESLFMMFLTMSFYFLSTNQKLPLLISLYLTPLTRFVGLFLVVPIYLYTVKKYLILSKNNYRFIIKNIFINAFSVKIWAVVIGFATYSTYLYLTKNDALAFFHSQKDFGMGRQTDLVLFPQVIYRYFKILFTADFSFQYIVALIELSAFLFVGLILYLEGRKLFKAKDFFSIRANLLYFSIINLLLPTFTGTFASIPRYTLASLSLFIYLSQITNKSLKISASIVFAVLHIFMFMFFIQGYFVS